MMTTYQYDNGAQSILSKLVEVLGHTSKRVVVDRKHFAVVVVVNVSVLNILHISTYTAVRLQRD